MNKEGNDEDTGSFWAGDHVGLNLAETDAMEKSRCTRVFDLSPDLRGAGTEGDRKKPRTNLSPPREKKNRRRKRSHRGNLKEGRRVLKKSQVKQRKRDFSGRRDLSIKSKDEKRDQEMLTFQGSLPEEFP